MKQFFKKALKVNQITFVIIFVIFLFNCIQKSSISTTVNSSSGGTVPVPGTKSNTTAPTPPVQQGQRVYHNKKTLKHIEKPATEKRPHGGPGSLNIARIARATPTEAAAADQGEAYERDLAHWQDWITQFKCAESTPHIVPSTDGDPAGTKNWSGTIKTVAIAGAVIAVALGLREVMK